MQWIEPTQWVIAPLLLTLGGLTACTVPAVDPASASRPTDPIAADPALLLPPLTAAALQQREAELSERIDSELALAGLGKIINLGKPIAPELEQYRQDWAMVNPQVAPFLGTWVRDWNLMPHDVTTVLPSNLPGQVCLVRYRQMETETVPLTTYTTPPEFSVALVVDGQLLSDTVQTATALIRFTPSSPYLPYDVEFLGTVEADGELRLLAAQQP
ncbi:MAG TPA: hypothetical protein VLS96_22570, partial [Nodosilinea sp.]|nr:hypothetical protein [Nodosilinea sp.]